VNAAAAVQLANDNVWAIIK